MFYHLKTLLVIEIILACGLTLFRSALPVSTREVVSGKVIGLTLLTPIVGVFSGNIYIFYGYFTCVIAFNSRSRSELSSIYALMIPSTPALVQQLAIGSAYVGSLSTILAMNLGALIGAVFRGSKSTKSNRSSDSLLTALLLIMMYIYNRDSSISGVVRTLITFFITYAGPYLLISRGLSSRADINQFLMRLCLGAVLTSLVGIFQANRHWVLYQTLHETLHVEVALQSWTLAMRAGLLRTGGQLLDYSAAGIFLAVSICLLPFIWKKFRKGYVWLIALSLIGGLIAAQSRGGWIAAIGGLIFVFIYRRQYAIAGILGGLGALAESYILFFVSEGRLARIAGATAESTGTVDYRKLLLQRGLEQIRAHPLFGQPQEQLVANLPDLVQGQHIVDFVNAHLFIAMTAGLPLFGLWVVIWTAPTVRAWVLRPKAGASADLTGVPAAILVPSMIGLIATSIIDRNLVWPTIALGLAAPCFALRRGDQQSARPKRSRSLVFSAQDQSRTLPVAG